MAGLNLTFSASGFLGIYHLGAASALLRHGRKLLGKVDNYTGASGGALVAAVLVSEPEKLEQFCKQFTYRFAADVRKQRFGALTPGYDFMRQLREGMEGILSADAHQKAHLRLHVSITNIKTMKNYLVSSFATREDFITILLASSFVPFYAGVKPVEYKGETWIDGGLTNRLPILPTGQTITVSPFDGQLDICPEGDGRTRPSIRIAKQDFILSKANFVRVNHAFFPPSQEKMEILYQNGFDDAVRFLRSKSWLD
ncbi:patatin-like phospholipase domain-containing protein 4 isoform X1 [Callorhinchus milii]|uniref:Patatin-like phospholipase domain-containing 4 n=1 Tax=Callorhinchus milii TaxID=7868 RepID=V9LBK6_CALMI|nr:patatin-like phospholipase domain-containing protein 4 isoform X1 [Callorhinchus milii]|eukprot:gi/632988789/ref/XP_007883300.1/ PREDICTED: patatin-like phospholipase domain-containing protein 4 [Callorhinchus milii]